MKNLTIRVFTLLMFLGLAACQQENIIPEVANEEPIVLTPQTIEDGNLYFALTAEEWETMLQHEFGDRELTVEAQQDFFRQQVLSYLGQQQGKGGNSQTRTLNSIVCIAEVYNGVGGFPEAVASSSYASISRSYQGGGFVSARADVYRNGVNIKGVADQENCNTNRSASATARYSSGIPTVFASVSCANACPAPRIADVTQGSGCSTISLRVYNGGLAWQYQWKEGSSGLWSRPTNGSGNTATIPAIGSICGDRYFRYKTICNGSYFSPWSYPITILGGKGGSPIVN